MCICALVSFKSLQDNHLDISKMQNFVNDAHQLRLTVLISKQLSAIKDNLIDGFCLEF